MTSEQWHLKVCSMMKKRCNLQKGNTCDSEEELWLGDGEEERVLNGHDRTANVRCREVHTAHQPKSLPWGVIQCWRWERRSRKRDGVVRRDPRAEGWEGKPFVFWGYGIPKIWMDGLAFSKRTLSLSHRQVTCQSCQNRLWKSQWFCSTCRWELSSW